MRGVLCALVVSAGFVGGVAQVAPVAEADSLPDCAMVAKGVQPDWGWDCQTRARDKSGLTFEGRRWSIKRYVDGFERSRLDEVRISGAVSQVIDEDVGVEDGLPFALEDLDGDGREELLIPLGPKRGMDVDEPANYQWAVWRARSPAGKFERVWVVRAASFRRTQDGHLVALERGLGAEGEVRFYQFGPDHAYPPKLVAGVDAHSSVFNGPYSPSGCELVDEDTDLATTGLDHDQAQQRFCADPWVQKLYQ
jgi:hypothetical protein